jgi:hypothetical protein
MSVALKVTAVLLVSTIAVLASQPEARAYVENCVCCICSHFFGS